MLHRCYRNRCTLVTENDASLLPILMYSILPKMMYFSLPITVELFQSEGYNVSSHKILHSVIDSCYGDKRNQALINYNGDVFKCTARDFLTENRLGYLNQNGIIIWEKNSLERRMTSKFNRPICHNCRIAPLCGGGCSQQAMENLFANECLYHYTKQDIDNIILNRFEFLVVNRYKK